MTDPAVPVEDPAQPEAAAAAAAPNRGRRLVLLAAVAVGVLAVAAKFLLLGGGDADSTPVALGSASPRPAATTPAGTSPSRTPASAVPAPFTDVVGRDPFAPLYQPPASPSAAPAAPAAPTTSAAGSVASSTSAATAGTAAAPAAAGTATEQRISLVRVTSKDGRTVAQTRVGSTDYTPAVGETFAKTFKLSTVTGACARYLNGDERFDLCEGQELVKR